MVLICGNNQLREDNIETKQHYDDTQEVHPMVSRWIGRFVSLDLSRLSPWLGQ